MTALDSPPEVPRSLTLDVLVNGHENWDGREETGSMELMNGKAFDTWLVDIVCSNKVMVESPLDPDRSTIQVGFSKEL